MKKKQSYIISFGGLKDGVHTFDYEVGTAFFSSFEDSLINVGFFEINIAFEKRNQIYTLDMEIGGKVEVECDRCLELFLLDVEKFRHQLHIKFSEEDKIADDVIYLKPGETEIDIAQSVYEFICLNIPLRRVHPENEDGESDCPEEILKHLEENEVPLKQEENKSPWDILKDMDFDK